MKTDLINLIDQIDQIKSYFHFTEGLGTPLMNTISDKAEFIEWKQELLLELQSIYDKTKDKFILDTIAHLKEEFSGWHDERSFDELSANLKAIKKNIGKYYSSETNQVLGVVETVNTLPKRPKIFISHSSEDNDFVGKLVGFLENIGLTEEHIICSSVSGFGIPIDMDIYDYLKEQFENHNLHVFLILSRNYYKSVPCLNEMGAAWVLQNKYTIILHPGFEFCEIEGAVNPRQIGLKFDVDILEVKDKLNQLKEILVREFDLSPTNGVRWENKRDEFIESITQIKSPIQKISRGAESLLQTACEDEDGTIIKTSSFSGFQLQAGRKEFVISQKRRDVAEWEKCFEELLLNEFITEKGSTGEVFVVSQKGYEFIEELKKNQL